MLTTGVEIAGGRQGRLARARTAPDLLVVLAVAAAVLLPALGLSFLDPDEGLYADMARAMVVTGDWALPRFNGLPYLEKPPLYLWLAAAALAAWDGEAAVRLPSAVAALASALLAWRIGRRLHGPRAGLLAGLALATTAGYALYVRKASTDFVFVACLTLAVYGFLRDAARPDRGRARFLLLYVGAALGLLTKGLIGLALPAAIVGVSLVWPRGPRLRLRDLNLGVGLAALAVVALPWHVLVAWREPDLFWFYLVDNQVLRFLDLRAFLEDDVPMTTAGFLLVTFLYLFPWGVFALARPGASPHPWSHVTIAWALCVVLFFALSRSKLEYYALPAFPALAVRLGGAWVAARDIRWGLAGGLAGCLLVGVAAVWVGTGLTPAQALAGLAELNVYYRIRRELGLGFPFDSARPFGLLLQGLGLALIAGWTAAALAWWRGRRGLAFACLLVLAVSIGALVVQLLYLVEPHHSARAVAEAISARAGGDDVVAHEGSLEYSAALPFYTGRRIVVVNGVRGDLDFASRLPEAHGMFLDDAGLAHVWGGGRRVFLVTPRWRDRSVVDALPADRVHLLGRYGSRWLYSNLRNAP
jgi:4-amino-4-deoxy-L-arabinose transferase-like glycosyltransferase